MTEFRLDPKLDSDCFTLGKMQISQLLLMNNALAPWFILVPEVEAAELYQLDNDIQQQILAEINQLSEFITQEYITDKLNVAAIGNIVNQLHIHIVGRTKSDFCWPNVVWGADQKKTYSDQEVKNITRKLKNSLATFTVLETYT
ncbi:MAG: HIT family protein [Pseudomonadales bacterium]|jgi:diadenosine tetraphosphate (Ap4A) HIT family hydrolase|nr:HIT family protein [Pseudomonadales bacterium]